jgi:hypothetical protein
MPFKCPICGGNTEQPIIVPEKLDEKPRGHAGTGPADPPLSEKQHKDWRKYFLLGPP